MKDDLLHAGDRLRGEIRISAASNFAAYRLPKILRWFNRQYPHVAVNVTSGLSQEVFAQLQHNDVHMALVKDALNCKEGKHLVDENRFYIVSRHPLALEDLPLCPQIRISHGPHISTPLDRWWNANFSRPPRIAMTVDKMEICLEMVRHGLGYAMLSDYLPFEDSLHPRLMLDEHRAPILNHTWLLYRHNVAQAPRLARFIQLLAPLPQAVKA